MCAVRLKDKFEFWMKQRLNSTLRFGGGGV